MTIILCIEVPIPFPLKTVNCYYIPDSNPTLIDTGVNCAEGLDIIDKNIRSAGGRLSGLKRILLTHGHTDHVGLAGKIASHSGAEVFIHPWDRDKIPIEGENWLEAIHAPGHSPGSICLYNREDGTLLAGDSLLEKITPNPVVEISPPPEDPVYQSVARYERTLKMMSALAVRTVLPGHGSPFRDHAGVVRQIQRHHRVRRERVLNLLKAAADRPETGGGLTPYRVALQLFADIRGVDIFLALSEAVGHLDYLRAKGAVDMQLLEGARVYRRTAKGD